MKTLTKEQNIFSLYDQLNKNGEKRKALGLISDVTGTSKATIKSHWLYTREIPQHVTDEQKDEIITGLQTQVFIQNQQTH